MFITLTAKTGERVLVNTRRIQFVGDCSARERNPNGTILMFDAGDDDYIIVNESFDDVSRLIKAAVGAWRATW